MRRLGLLSGGGLTDVYCKSAVTSMSKSIDNPKSLTRNTLQNTAIDAERGEKELTALSIGFAVSLSAPLCMHIR